MKNSRNSEELRIGCIQVPVSSAEENKDRILFRLSGLSFKLKHTSAQTVLKANMHLFSVIKQTLTGCAKIKAEWLKAALSEQACAAGDKLFWSGLGFYLQSRWLLWFKIAPSQSGCRWKTRSVQGPAKTSTLTAVLYALMGPQNFICELCKSFGARITKTSTLDINVQCNI